MSRILVSNFYKTAYRNLLKHKLTTSLNVIGLTLGISCFIMISVYVNHEYNFDRHYENHDRIYRVTLDITSIKANETLALSFANPQLPEELRELYPEVESATGIIKTDRAVSVKTSNATFREEQFYKSDAHYFGVFKHAWIAGNPDKALAGPNSLVLTESLARKYFGDDNSLNRSLVIDGETYNVTGVIEDLLLNTDLKFDALLSSEPTDWALTYLKFKSGADAVGFQQKLDSHFEEYAAPVFAQSDSKGAYHLEALTDIHFNEAKAFDRPKGSVVALYTFSLIAFLILIISCVNYVNMGLAQSVRRQAEIGVRKIFGASRNQVRLQFVTESFLITMVSSVAAVIVVSLLIQGFQSSGILSITLDANLLIKLFAFVVGILLLISISSGSFVGLRQVNSTPASDLKGGATIGRRSAFGSSLVVLQFIVVIALIFSTRVVNRQMTLLATSHQGFNKEQVMVVDIPLEETIYDQLPALKNSLLGISNVSNVSLAGYHSIPTSELSADTYVVKQHGQDMVKMLNQLYVDEDYFDALAIEFAEGRKFNPFDDETTAVIVNEAMVKSLGWTEPLDQTIDYGISGTLSGEGAKVIGVTKDFGFHGLQKKAVPLQFYLLGERTPEKILIKLGNADMESIIDIERVWNTALKGQSFEYRFMDEYFQQQLEREDQLQKLMLYFSGICIVIACLGLIGMINIRFVQRMKATGIRKILGAQTVHLLLQSWKGQFIQLGAASIIALPLALFAMNRWLEGFSTKVSIGFIDYVIAFAVLGGAVLLVMLWQLVKLVKLKPLESIKQE